MRIEVKVKVARTIDGKLRKMTETYILEEEFFAEAEYKVTHQLNDEQAEGELEGFEIQSLRISPIKEIDEQSLDNNLPSFMVTLKDLFHEDDGTEKQIRYKVLLWAEDLTDANNRAHELSHQGYDMLIEGIKQVDFIYLQGVDHEQED